MAANISLHSSGKQTINQTQTNTSSVTLNGSTDRLNIVFHNNEPLQMSMRNVNTTSINVDTPSQTTNNYNNLVNLPTLNGVVIKGNLVSSDLFIPKESINTKEYWASKPLYIPQNGEIIIYTNKTTIDNVNYPGVKIGDGNAYLADLPFISDERFAEIISMLTGHIDNESIHVTAEKKAFWNNKLNCDINDETLIFNRN